MKQLFVFIFIINCVPVVYSQQNLQSNINQIISKPFYKHANIGISVRDVKTGELLAEVSKDKVMIPASTMKLVTTFVGHQILGENFTFETRISYDGELDAEGNLRGNIYIEGSGDPTLGSDRIPGSQSASVLITKIADDIYLHGIKCIEGNIIADQSVFDSSPISSSWQWNDLGNYYASGAWGLNFNENTYSIFYERSGPIGSLTKISHSEPVIPGLKLDNYVTVDSANSVDNAYIFGGPHVYNKRVEGTIPQGKTIYKVKGALPDPPNFFASTLLKELRKREMGCHMYSSLSKIDDKKKLRKWISSYRSPSLKNIVRVANELSINIYAESILKTLGHMIGKKGSDLEGIAAIEEYLVSRSIDVTALHMEDGSGLSARNLMSPEFLTDFLYRFLRGKNENYIKELMPAVGVSGTVKNLLSQSKAKGNMWVKSGSMDKILNYAGYCKTASGRLVAFSVFLNGSTAKKMKDNKTELEKILDAIYRFS